MTARRSRVRAVLPGSDLPPWRRTLRHWISRTLVWLLVRAWARIRFEGRERLPAGPAVYCFNHLSWADPFVLMAILPFRPRLYFFGPKEEDMAVGRRNRLMAWSGAAIPYKPGKNDLLDATRQVAAIIESGGIVAIAGEGRIGAEESAIWPLNDGPAFFALRSRVPLVAISINGTSWLGFGTTVRVRVGEPIVVEGRPDRATLSAVTDRLRMSLEALIADAPEVRRPGRIGRWLTNAFNDWPDGSREATVLAARVARAEAAAERASGEGVGAEAAGAPGTG